MYDYMRHYLLQKDNVLCNVFFLLQVKMYNKRHIIQTAAKLQVNVIMQVTAIQQHRHDTFVDDKMTRYRMFRNRYSKTAVNDISGPARQN